MSAFKGEGNRIEYPPPATGGCQNQVQSVRLQQGEKVQWYYAHTQQGSFVTGYEIVPYPLPDGPTNRGHLRGTK